MSKDKWTATLAAWAIVAAFVGALLIVLACGLPEPLPYLAGPDQTRDCDFHGDGGLGPHMPGCHQDHTDDCENPNCLLEYRE